MQGKKIQMIAQNKSEYISPCSHLFDVYNERDMLGNFVYSPVKFTLLSLPCFPTICYVLSQES